MDHENYDVLSIGDIDYLIHLCDSLSPELIVNEVMNLMRSVESYNSEVYIHFNIHKIIDIKNRSYDPIGDMLIELRGLRNTGNLKSPC